MEAICGNKKILTSQCSVKLQCVASYTCPKTFLEPLEEAGSTGRGVATELGNFVFTIAALTGAMKNNHQKNNASERDSVMASLGAIS